MYGSALGLGTAKNGSSYTGIMEKKMETTVMGSIGLYKGYTRIVEKKMETAVLYRVMEG